MTTRVGPGAGRNESALAEDSERGWHACGLHDTDETQAQSALEFVGQGLDQGEMVLCLGNEHLATAVRASLEGEARDVGALERAGRLGFVDAIGIVPTPSSVVASVQARTRQALDQGYSGLRVVVQVSCLAAALRDLTRLLELESSLDRLTATLPVTVLCLYDRRLVEPGFLLQVLDAHPECLVDDQVVRNLYHTPHHAGPDAPQLASLLSERLQSLRAGQAREVLRQAREQFRSLFEQAPVALCYCSLQGRFIRVNPRYSELLGYSGQELVGRHFADITHPDDLELSLQGVRQLLSGEVSTFVTDKRYLRKDGDELWGHITVSVVRDPRGRPRHFLVVFEDVTERKRAGEALRESEQRFRCAVDNSPFPVIIHAEDGEILRINQALTDITGYRHEDIPTVAEWSRRVYAEQHQLMYERIQTVYQKTERSSSGEYPILTATGTSRTWSFSSAPLGTLPDGRKMVISTAFDVTEQREMEARLRHSEKMDAIGRLAGGVAHDFNNQLQGVLGYASLLVRRLQDPVMRRYADNIVKASTSARDLTNQLLAFARKGRYVSIATDIHVVINDMAALLRPGMDRGIAMRLDLRAEPATFVGDPTQMQSALLNLALNARDAMPDGGELTITTRVTRLVENHLHLDIPAGSYLHVSVADTGIGLGEEARGHLFEPFYTTKGPGKGTGLGLAAVYGTIKSHHGAIHAEAGPAGGTIFHLYLPLLESTEVSSSLSHRVSEEPSRIRAHVMVVDDEQMVRDFLVDTLEEMGCRVTTCTDGEDAVQRYRRCWSDIDLVLLDMVMPRLGGRETFLAMREINPRVQALLSSGYSLEGEAQRILDAGVVGFIQKPFRVDDLALKVRKALVG